MCLGATEAPLQFVPAEWTLMAAQGVKWLRKERGSGRHFTAAHTSHQDKQLRSVTTAMCVDLTGASGLSHRPGPGLLVWEEPP